MAGGSLARARFALDRAVAHPDAPDTAQVLQSMFRALEQAVRTHDTAHIATLFTRDIIATFGAFNDAPAKLDD